MKSCVMKRVGLGAIKYFDKAVVPSMTLFIKSHFLELLIMTMINNQ